MPKLVLACSCLVGASRENLISMSDAVVTAQAVSISDKKSSIDGLRWADEQQIVHWRVLNTQKGSHFEGEIITTKTNLRCCSCGMKIDAKGVIKVLYLSGAKPYKLSICTSFRHLQRLDE